MSAQAKPISQVVKDFEQSLESLRPTIAKQLRFVKNPSIATRRDTALIAAICAAPARGTPRKWPQNCLKITETEVLLWDAPIEEPCFAISLRFWHAWRERSNIQPITPEKIRVAFLCGNPLQ